MTPLLKFKKKKCYLIKNNSPSHCVDNGFRLFKNFFLHKRLEISLHYLLKFEFDSVDVTCNRISRRGCRFDPVKSQTSFDYGGDIVVFQINYAICVFDNSTRKKFNALIRVGPLFVNFFFKKFRFRLKGLTTASSFLETP